MLSLDRGAALHGAEQTWLWSIHLAPVSDPSGNVGTSSSVAIAIANDTEPPVATIQSPANGSKVSGTVSVAATATDNKQVAKLTLVIDGAKVAQAFGPSISYSWNTGTTTIKKRGGKNTSTALTRSIKVTATDTAGNTSSSSISVTTQ